MDNNSYDEFSTTAKSGHSIVAVSGQSTRAGLIGMSWAHFLNDGSANYLPGILPAVLISLHTPVSMAGVLMGALLIGQALQPIMGWIADRLGGRSLVIIGLAGSTAGGALLGFATQIWAVIGLLLLIGVGNAMFHPQALAGVRSILITRQGLGLSVFLVGGELGRGVWPVLTSWIVVRFGMPSLWLLALPALVTLPLLLRWAPSLPARTGRTAPIHWSQHRKPMVLLIGFASARSLITYGTITFIPLLWHLHGGSLVSGASIITTLLTVGVVGNLSGGHLADQFGRRPIMILSSTLAVILVPLILYAQGAWIWILAAALGISLFATSPITVLMGQDIFPENRSLGSGIALGLANGIGAMLVLIIGIWASAATIGSIVWLLAAMGLISVLTSSIMPSDLVTNRRMVKP